MSSNCLIWSEADLVWSEANITWEDACIVLEIVGGAGNYLQNYNSLPKSKKKKFISLVLTLKGQTIEQQKQASKTYKVTVRDIELVASKLLSAINVEFNSQKQRK